MSRRFYRHAEQMVCVGWDRGLQQFFMTVASLCPACAGTGELDDFETPCMQCRGEGVQPGSEHEQAPAATLEAIASQLGQLGIPLPQRVRADLEQDKQTNVGEVVEQYDDVE